jgi:hypothetical protein
MGRAHIVYQGHKEPVRHSLSYRDLCILLHQSRYINQHNLPTIKRLFPNMNLEMLDAGHWVHAER